MVGIENPAEGRLYKAELFWRDHQPWLKECGYLLRPRYLPDWKASWVRNKSLHYRDCEDGVIMKFSGLLDATRIDDGKHVVLKKFHPSSGSAEAEISLMFSGEPHVSNPKNHCIPTTILDVPDEEDTQLLVMPLLQSWEQPKFNTIGEVVDFFRQVFEGLQYMHTNGVAHRDCKYNNILMDPTGLYSVLPHPLRPHQARDFRSTPSHTTRTLAPVKYYFIDFGVAKKYDLSVPPEERLEPPGWGAGDWTIPEFKKDELCDPFAVDVYCIGHLIQSIFLDGDEHSNPKKGLDFMRRLVKDMCKENPKDRPTMDQVMERFEHICVRLSDRKLRSRVASKKELWIVTLFRSHHHRRTQNELARQGISAIPNCPPELARRPPGIFRRMFSRMTPTKS